MANFKIKFQCLLVSAIFLTACRKDLSELRMCSNEVAIKIEKLLPDSLHSFDNLNIHSLNLIFYPKQKGIPVEKKIPGKEGTVSLPLDRYDILIYTSDFYELDAIFYRGLTNVQTAEAYTKTVTSSTPLQIAEPDPLFSVFLEDVDIEAEQHRLQNIDMHPLAFAYRFKVYVDGIKFVKSASAMITGLYSTAFLKDGKHREEEVARTVIPLEIKGDYIYGDFYIFGTHQKREIEHRIVIAFVNGKTETIELENLTAKLKAMPRGGELQITQKITITGNGDDSGFTPGVSGWDDEITIPFNNK